MKIKITKLNNTIKLPAYQHPGEDAGLDIVSAERCVLTAQNYRMIKTGFKLAVPAGYAGFVYPRSGLARKHGVTVLNSPGVIDSGYRGEVGVVLINHSDKDFYIEKGDRIAQLIVQPVEAVIWEETDQLPPSERAETGFGDSGR